jgi:hypothetical protein
MNRAILRSRENIGLEEFENHVGIVLNFGSTPYSLEEKNQ